jgi:hypothetical protein
MKKLLFLLILLSFNSFSQSIFEIDGKFGLKGNDSTLLLKPEYEQIHLYYSLYEVNKSFQIKIKNKMKVFFGEGDLKEGLDSFSETEGRTPPKYVTVQLNGKRGLFRLSKNGSSLKRVLPTKFQSFQAIYNQSRTDFEEGEIQLFLLQKGNKWAITPIKNQKIRRANYEFDSLAFERSSKNWVLAKKSGKWGFIDKQNLKIKTGFIYSQKPDFRFENTYFIERLSNRNKRYLILNKKNNSIETLEYFNLSKSQFGGLIGKKNGYWGVVHTSGITLLPFKYDGISFKGNHALKLCKNEKFGLAFYSDSEVSEEPESDSFSENYHPIEVKVPLAFDNITKKNALYFVQKGSFFGIYSQKGQLILPAEYDKIEKLRRETELIVEKKWKARCNFIQRK